MGRVAGILVICIIVAGACAGPGAPTTPSVERMILYTSQIPGETEDVRLLDPASGVSSLLVAGDSVSARNGAVWSSDGRRVAYIRELGNREELFVLDSLAGSPRRIGDDLPASVFFPDWSPDGHRLAVSAGDDAAHQGVYIVDVATGVSRRVRADSSAYRCPTWSPTGDRLVVAAYRSAASALVVVDTFGVVLDTLIHSDSTYLDCPHWSPRGDEVLFTIFHGGGLSGWERAAFHSNLAITDLSSRRVEQITRDRGLTNYGRWARDGERIVFQSDRHTEPTADATGVGRMLQSLEIWIVHRDGSGLQRLTTNSNFDAHPSW